MLDVRLLGTFEARENKKAVIIPSRPAQSLFAYLILTAGTSHRREKLAGLLWPDSLEETARDNLRHALWKIRKALPSPPKTEYLLADDLTIAFNASADYRLDAAMLAKAGENASADELIAVLPVYQGDLLPGFYDEWVMLEREHLNSVFEHHMARLMLLLQQENRWLDILEWGERWIKLGQKPESAYRALMSAHAAKGDMSKVAATYERCVESLKEYGFEPSEQTCGLYERLKTGNQHFKPEPTAPVKEGCGESPKTNLPSPITNFIGREKEFQEVVRLVERNRLVTLTGPGGVGKTRLAIQSSNGMLGEFRDGVWWVELAPLSDGALVPQAVAQALGVREIPGRGMAESLKTFLHGKQLLLVLDNCEHLIDKCAQFVDDLLTHCASLKILATSREALGITGEMTYEVPSLSLPTPQSLTLTNLLMEYEGIRFFVERAVAVKPDFELTEQNAAAVVQICRRLDGIPLALELAAARIKLLTAEQIAERLDDRFDLLIQGSRAALPRHQTLRAAIDWSYDLLSEEARILFRRLSVFAGGFTLEAAEAICSKSPLTPRAVLNLLARLIDRSLVKATRAGEDERYSMLETIREYALEKLREAGEEQIIRSRHSEFFLRMVEEIGPKLDGAVQKIWLDRLEVDIDNLRGGMDWALENGETIKALRFAGALPRFWFIRAHHSEGVERLRTILDRPDTREPTPARLRALNAYLLMLWPSDQLMEIQSRGTEALEMSLQLGDRRNSAFALLWLGVKSTAQGDYSQARSYLEQSLEIWHELKEKNYTAWSFVFLGEVALLQSDISHAQVLYLQAVPLLSEAHDYPFLAVPLRRLGQLAMSEGDLLKAVPLLKESLLHNWGVHDYRGTGACLAALAALSLAQQKTEHAIKLFGVVDAILEFIRTPLLPFDQQQYDQNVSQLRDQLEAPAIIKIWEEGRAMALEQAIEFALEEARQ